MSTATRRLRVARKRKRVIASLLDALEHERITLESILEDPPAALGNVSINTVMKRAPGLGPEGIRKCLTEVRVWPLDRLGKLDAETRAKIIKHLPPRARRYKSA